MFVERRFQGCESSMERNFLEHSLLRSESSTGAKVPWNESSWTFRSPGANVPRNESSTGTKVPRERKFSLWSFRSRERKCRGTKRPVTWHTIDKFGWQKCYEWPLFLLFEGQFWRLTFRRYTAVIGYCSTGVNKDGCLDWPQCVQSANLYEANTIKLNTGTTKKSLAGCTTPEKAVYIYLFFSLRITVTFYSMGSVIANENVVSCTAEQSSSCHNDNKHKHHHRFILWLIHYVAVTCRRKTDR